MDALFGDGVHQVHAVNAYGGELRVDSVDGVRELLTSAAQEIWFRLEGPAVHLAGEFKAADTLVKNSGGARVLVIVYKSGRFDIRYDRLLRPLETPGDRTSQSFDTWLPEGRGWVGLIVMPLDRRAARGEAIAWRTLRMW